MDLQIRFCNSADGTRIAYGIYGSGPPLFFANTWVLSMDAQFAWADARAFFDAIAKHATLLLFDRRGSGASEREVTDFSPQVEAEDISAVAEAAGIGQFPLFADATAGAACACYAAAQPERVRQLIIWAPHTSATLPDARDTAEHILKDWSYFRRVWAGRVYPDGPVQLQRAAGKAFKQSVSPEVAARRFESLLDLDLLALLRAVAQPALVLQRETRPGGMRQFAMQAAAVLPHGQLQFVPGLAPTTYPEHERLLEAVLGFVGITSVTPSEKESPSATAVILFADIVDSTALTERLGDTAFRDRARDLDTTLRHIIRGAGGTPVEGKLLGDGVLAVFTSARQAIEAALKCGAAGDESGLPLHLGLHAGDVIEEGGNVFGGAVNIAARIAGESAAGEVLVSQTVRELARTSAGVGFEDAGERELKGVGEPVRVWRVIQSDS